MNEPSAHHHVVVGEERIIGVVVPAPGNVRSVLGEQQRRTIRCGAHRIDDDRQRLGVHDHRLCRIYCRRVRLSHDDRDRFTHEPDAVAGEEWTGERAQTRPPLLGEVQVIRGQRGDHPRHPRRRRGVDTAQRAVRDRAAHEHRVQESLDGEVGQKLCFAGQQRRVFHPLDVVSKHRPRHPEKDRAGPVRLYLPAGRVPDSAKARSGRAISPWLASESNASVL